jgi:hypothetical protein
MMLRVLLCVSALSLSACVVDKAAIKERLDTLSGTPAPSGIAQFTVQEQIESLKQALSQGAETAVKDLARENGYLGNPKVRIPLPDSLQKTDAALRKYGFGKYADEFAVSMNRAAEAAVPEAKTLLINAVKNMTVTDAKDILLGKEDAATQYFRRNTEAALGERFKPIVTRSMQQVGLAQTYNKFAGTGVRLGLVNPQDVRLEDYITRKGLDGLFLMMAEQEKKIRDNPLQATGELARKVFSVLRGQ